MGRCSVLLAVAALVACSEKPASGPGSATDPAAGKLVSSHGGTPAVANTAAAQVTAPIAPPSGGTSIADVWAKRKALVGKSVTVRGKVVKFNGGILGVNWLHIQDGSGSATDGTNDLTVTSDIGANVGDVVTATGIVAIDKDFGAGYAYAVIVEKAKIVQ